jgi:divalent metal cation (Fe/Co/Zn/Cd) transporter
MTITATPRERLRQRARYLAYATIAWNTVEAFVAIGSGIAAGSIALIGFGLDSTVEVFAASVALWFLRSHHDREERALRLIAISYFVLAGYVTLEALRDLVVDTEAATSNIGIGLAATFHETDLRMVDNRHWLVRTYRAWRLTKMTRAGGRSGTALGERSS